MRHPVCIEVNEKVASLHFSGHSFSITPCLRFVRIFIEKCVSTEIKVYLQN